jgi:hypothetical protein
MFMAMMYKTEAHPALKPFSAAACTIVPGDIYEHYSGKRYRIVGVARHSETLEEYVTYQALYGTQDIWIRPLSMFVEMVVKDGIEMPRFKRLQL